LAFSESLKISTTLTPLSKGEGLGERLRRQGWGQNKDI